MEGSVGIGKERGIGPPTFWLLPPPVYTSVSFRLITDF